MFDNTTESELHEQTFTDAVPTSQRYLHRRGETYYFKRKIPTDVPHAFGSKGETHWQSLKTNSLQEALRRLPAEIEAFDSKVRKARESRRQGKVPVASRPRTEGTTKYLQEAHIPSIIERFEYSLLQTDMEERRVMEDDAELDIRLADFEQGLKLKKRAAAREEFSHVEDVAQVLLEDERLIAPPGSAARTLLLRELMRADIQTLQKQCDALRGNLFALPPTVPVAPRDLPTMQTAFEAWRQSQDKDRTIDAYGRYVRQFESENRELPMASISLETANKFRDYLHGCDLDRESIINCVGGLATLWDFYERKSNRITSNPFREVQYDGLPRRESSVDRRRFEVSELAILFNSPVYLGQHKLKGQVKESAYWAPLLGPFVGARIEEIAQLRIADILRINGVWCIRIENLEHDQRTKNMGSHRLVPMHKEVIQCGFLSYVAKQKLAGQTHVFPSQRNTNKYRLWSNALTKWFGSYMNRIGLEDPRLVYHSFRFTFKRQCTVCGISDEVRDALTGHWLSRNSSNVYTSDADRQYPFPAVARGIKKLRYDELDLRHLHVADPFDQVDRAWKY
ncbi:site-specific integrase [Variovorax defluvii]